MSWAWAVLQAEPEAGFLKDAIEDIDAQETKDKPTLVGARVVRLNCRNCLCSS